MRIRSVLLLLMFAVADSFGGLFFYYADNDPEWNDLFDHAVELAEATAREQGYEIVPFHLVSDNLAYLQPAISAETDDPEDLTGWLAYKFDIDVFVRISLRIETRELSGKKWSSATVTLTGYDRYGARMISRDVSRKVEFQNDWMKRDTEGTAVAECVDYLLPDLLADLAADERTAPSAVYTVKLEGINSAAVFADLRAALQKEGFTVLGSAGASGDLRIRSGIPVEELTVKLSSVIAGIGELKQHVFYKQLGRLLVFHASPS